MGFHKTSVVRLGWKRAQGRDRGPACRAALAEAAPQGRVAGSGKNEDMIWPLHNQYVCKHTKVRRRSRFPHTGKGC